MAFIMKRNDTRPAFRSQLTQPSAADPAVYEAVNLTGATVKFIMSKDNTVKVNAAATIDNATEGRVSYTWTGTDTNTEGVFNVEWEVTFSAGVKQTFPSDGYLTVEVKADLDSA